MAIDGLICCLVKLLKPKCLLEGNLLKEVSWLSLLTSFLDGGLLLKMLDAWLSLAPLFSGQEKSCSELNLHISSGLVAQKQRISITIKELKFFLVMTAPIYILR